jgi:ectoine hydroxylase-related dioxygenase (phytanoyl-CoA dioxygenase family)
MDVELMKVELDEIGFVVVEGLIPRSESLAIATTLMDRVPWEGRKAVFSNLDYESWGPLLELVSNPTVLELAESQLGPGFKMNGDVGRTTATPSRTNFTPDPFHADVPLSGWFTENRRPFPENCPCVQTIWALTDFSKENGATEIVPFSHRSGRMPREDGDYERYALPVEVPAGSVVLFHCGLWHRRGHNVTTAVRVGLSTPFVAQWLDPVVQGWKVMPRRVWELLPPEIQRLNPHSSHLEPTPST